jgi:hypothetical protein
MRFLQNNKKFLGFVSLSLFVISCFLFSSCNKDEGHPITFKFWINGEKNKIMKFNKDGSCYDLYDFSNTKDDRYEVGEKLLTIFRKTNGARDTVKAEILALQGDNLVIKYKDYIDSLKTANKSELIIGNWVPTSQEFIQDSFEITSKEKDCIKKDTSKIKKYFRYTFINDSLVEFNFFEKGIKEKYQYFESADNLLLMLKKKDYIISLKRK